MGLEGLEVRFDLVQFAPGNDAALEQLAVALHVRLGADIVGIHLFQVRLGLPQFQFVVGRVKAGDDCSLGEFAADLITRKADDLAAHTEREVRCQRILGRSGKGPFPAQIKGADHHGLYWADGLFCRDGSVVAGAQEQQRHKDCKRDESGH